MVMDAFVVPRLFKLQRPLNRVTPWQLAAPINWIGVIALLAGVVFGSYTGGLIPNTPGFGTTYIGYPALQAWALSAILYLIGVWVAMRVPETETLLGYPLHDKEQSAAAPAAAAAPLSSQ
jgi:formate-dependent nitrite reductase membrane component NrfD